MYSMTLERGAPAQRFAPAPARHEAASVREPGRALPFLRDGLDVRGCRDVEVLCVHFSADGREHGMWFLGDDAEEGLVGARPVPLPSGSSTCWYAGASGLARAEVSRGPNVLCDAVLLMQEAEPSDPGET